MTRGAGAGYGKHIWRKIHCVNVAVVMQQQWLITGSHIMAIQI
jgi:hypothetical protein